MSGTPQRTFIEIAPTGARAPVSDSATRSSTFNVAFLLLSPITVLSPKAFNVTDVSYYKKPGHPDYRMARLQELHPAFFFVIFDSARMKWCSQTFRNHAFFGQRTEGGVKLSEIFKILEDRFNHSVGNIVAQLVGCNDGCFWAPTIQYRQGCLDTCRQEWSRERKRDFPPAVCRCQGQSGSGYGHHRMKSLPEKTRLAGRRPRSLRQSCHRKARQIARMISIQQQEQNHRLSGLNISSAFLPEPVPEPGFAMFTFLPFMLATSVMPLSTRAMTCRGSECTENSARSPAYGPSSSKAPVPAKSCRLNVRLHDTNIQLTLADCPAIIDRPAG